MIAQQGTAVAGTLVCSFGVVPIAIVALFGGVACVAILLWTAWLFVGVANRGIAGLQSMFAPVRKSDGKRRCPYSTCRAVNVKEAKYCRLCGRRLD